MELSLSAPARESLVRRAAPICCGAALAAGAAFISAHDPSATGAHYPGCAFHQMTGLWCPGCGLTRGTYELLHGHVGTALGYNVFTPLALAAIVVAWLAWLIRSWGGSTVRVPPQLKRWSAATGLVSVIAYGALRNLPITPLRALAP